MQIALSHLNLHLNGILHSYSQIMFAKNKWIGFVLLLVSFLYPTVGVCGLLCGIGANALAHLLNQDTTLLNEGVWGFGAVMVGMYLGYQYEFATRLFLLVALASFLYLVLTVGFYGVLSKKRLPFLTLPFMVTIWVLHYFAFSVTGLTLNPFYVSPLLASQYQITPLLDVWLGNHITNIYSVTFLKTLSGIFFNGSLTAGIVILLCVFFFSRMATLMMVLGFSSAFLVYKAFGLPVYQLTVGLAGANYIFFGLAMGGFYLIGNKWALLITIALMPILTGFVFFFNGLLYNLGLTAFTLSFAVTAIAFIYFIKFKAQQNKLVLVWNQLNQPEANLYSYLNGLDRYKNSQYVRIGLPFLGDWWVSQSHNGQQTHLGEWKYAFDFIILDEEGKSYASHGTTPEDYYCFNKPVLAPAAGYVTAIQDNIKDNAIADINLESNWGNSIVIKHAEGLYSQISHIKMNSFKVWVGQYVNKGDIIGYCGNSGRSAEPHIHLQLQTSPAIGAPTLNYPLSYYFNKDRSLETFGTPAEYTLVSNSETNPLLANALWLIPGKKLKITYQGNTHYWEVFTDAYNRTYIYSFTDKATMYFANDGHQFNGISFSGPSKSPLKHFYKALYRVFLGYEQDLVINDSLPVNLFGNLITNTLQDILAPVTIFNRAKYKLTYSYCNSIYKTESMRLNAQVNLKVAGINISKTEYELYFSGQSIEKITIKNAHQTEEILCVTY
ncbi:MAG: urea transporter [Flexibacteraceae bacterium]